MFNPVQRSLHFGIVILLAVTLAAGQNLPAPPTPNQNLGLNANQSYHGDHEDINLATGNVLIGIPLLGLPGRNGHDLDISLHYNSQMWRLSPSVQRVNNSNGQQGTITFWQWTNSSQQALPMAAGWFGFGQQPTVVHDTNVQVDQGTDSQGRPVHQFCDTNYRLLMPDGGIHHFPGIKTNCYLDEPGGYSPVYGNLLVGDTDYQDPLWMRYDVNNGLISPTGDRWAGATFEDTNGNLISSSGGINQPPIIYTDTVGRSVQLSYPSGAIIPNALTYKDSSGATQTIALNYLTFTTTGSFSNPPPVPNSGQANTYSTAAMTCSASTPCQWTMLSSIVLPNGLTYTFHYNSAFGELDQITYPSGGYTRYEYGTFQRGIRGDMQGPETPMGPWDFREVVARHVCRASVVPRGTLTYTAPASAPTNTCPVPEDTTTYSPTINVYNVNNASISVTDPLGNVTVAQFCVGSQTSPCDDFPYETKRQIYDNASHLLRTIDTSYTGAPSFFKTGETITLDNGLVSKTEWDYQTAQRLYSQPWPPGVAQVPLTVTDPTGNVTEQREFDYGQGSPGPLVRKTDTAWSDSTPGAPFNNRKTSETIYDGSGNLVAQTTFEHDIYTQGLAASGATQHDSAYGTSYSTRGNITAVKRWRNTDNSWLTTRYQYDDAGNRLSATDPLNNTTTFDYTDSWASFSGSSGGSACAPSSGQARAYVTKVTDALSHATTKSYYSCSGLYASTTDPNNQTSTFTYDLMGRQLTANFPGGGQTGFDYHGDALPLKNTKTVLLTSNQNIVTSATLDGLGRVNQTQLNSDPSGIDNTDIAYDSLGRVAAVTNPYRSTSDPTYGVIQTQYDALGRPTQVTKQDGSLVATQYDQTPANSANGNCIIATDEAGKPRKSCVDGLGRLIEVDEPQSNAIGTTSTASVSLSGTLAAVGYVPANGTSSLSPNRGSDPGQAVYFDSNQHIIAAALTSSGLSTWLDLTTLSGCCPAAGNSAITTNVSSGGLVYQTADLHIHQIWWWAANSRWVNNDMTAASGATVAAVSGTSLVAYSDSLGIHEVFIGQDGHIYDLFYNGSNSTVDLTNLSGCCPAATNSSLTTIGNNPGAVIYQSTDGHIHQIWWWAANSRWVNNDMSAASGATVAARSGTPLVGFSDSQGIHEVYIGQDGHIYDLFYNGSNSTLDLTNLSGGVAAAGNSLFTTVVNNAGAVIYQSVDGHVHQIWWWAANSRWVNNDMTAASGASVATRSGTPLAAFSDSQGIHEAYIGQDNHIYDLFYNGSNSTRDMTANAGSDSGTVSLSIGADFNAVACFGSSTNASCNGQPVNVTTSQVASALAQAINVPASPATATAAGSTINLTWKIPGAFTPTVSALSTTHDNPSLFPNPSFTSQATTFGGGTDNFGSAPYVTLYSYDALSNLLSVNQKGDGSQTARVRSFTYDSLSRLLTATNPESGAISYSYDANGNLLYKTSPAPNQTGTTTTTTSFCYDALNRVLAKGYSNPNPQQCSGNPPALPSPAVTYSYDSGTNGIGHLTSLADQAGSGSYTYDVLGRIASESRTIAGIQKSLGYTYNLDSSIATLTYPSTAVVTYTPDGAGRMLSGVDVGNAINYVTSATYGPDSSLTGFVSGNSASFAGITNSFSYSKRLQPVNMSAASTTATVFNIGYDFHFGNADNGNVYGITNNRDTNRSQTFTYDALNRLTSAQNSGTDCGRTTVNNKTAYWGNSYVYDSWGNLLQKNATKCSPEGLVVIASSNNQIHTGNPPAQNQACATSPDYLYDAAGNMTCNVSGSLTPQSYTYDQENRITGAAGFTYSYDADGNRVEKSNGTTGTIYWYMTPGIVAESDLTGALKSEYIFFDGDRVARKDFSGSTTSVFYYFSDHLKTASVITDSAGTIKEDEDYYPWGGELQFVNNDSNHYKFTSKERDSETGLDYFGARYYGNWLGRFITPDWSSTPIPVPYADLGDPQSLNQYSYVRNIPTVKVDADGHSPDWWQRLRNIFKKHGCYPYPKGCKTDRELEAERRDEAVSDRLYLITAKHLNALQVAQLTDEQVIALSDALDNGDSEVTVDGVRIVVEFAASVAPSLPTSRTSLLNTAQNQKLRNIINDLYRPGAKVGSGSTADAIRQELQTGASVGGKLHFQKGLDYRTALQKLLHDPSLSRSDRDIVKEVLTDLQNALSGH